MVTGTNSSLQTQLTFTACSFPMTSTSGTSWYQGDKLRATYTAKLTGSRTRRVAPMFSPSVITALNETKDNSKVRQSKLQLCWSLHLQRNYPNDNLNWCECRTTWQQNSSRGLSPPYHFHLRMFLVKYSLGANANGWKITTNRFLT